MGLLNPVTAEALQSKLEAIIMAGLAAGDHSGRIAKRIVTELPELADSKTAEHISDAWCQFGGISER